MAELSPDVFATLAPEAQALITFLLKENAELKARIAELEARLAKNSRNSSKPPSSDGLLKPNPKSQRERTDRKPGGQPGHKGSTLKFSSEPDHIIEHPVVECSHCHFDLRAIQFTRTESRQVVDLPAIKCEVTEHRIQQKQCPHCGKITCSQFPSGVRSFVGYGERIKGFALYLMNQQFIPYDRLKQMFFDLFAQTISRGSFHTFQKECAQILAPVVEGAIRDAAIGAEVAHFDETGLRCEKKNHWLHVASGKIFTYYAVHRKRGRVAFDSIGILSSFKGVAVHDFWEPYFDYVHCKHAACNAHILRELTFTEEECKEDWAKRMKAVLLKIHKKVEKGKQAGRSRLGPGTLKDFNREYQQVIASGTRLHSTLLPLPKNRGRQKQRPGKNLLDRLDRQRNLILAFMTDFRVPFTNNLAEQDIRMQKVKSKISGCFRTMAGAERFCRIRSYISTARKQHYNVYSALQKAIRGTPWVPAISLT